MPRRGSPKGNSEPVLPKVYGKSASARVWPPGDPQVPFMGFFVRFSNMQDRPVNGACRQLFTYDLASHLTSITRPNNTVRLINYDDDGETTNIIEKTTTGFPIAFFTLNWTTNSGRVAREFAGPLPHAYTPPTRAMMFDDDNRISNFNGLSVVYDNNGNMTSGPLLANTLVTYSFDARNRLLTAGGINYAYDPAANRVGLTNGTAWARFVINPSGSLPQVLMRIQSGVTNYYIYGAGLLYQVTETATSTNTLTYHYDYRGSTVALTDASGNLTDRIEYSAYAMTAYRSGTNDIPFLFNGRYGVQTDPNGLLYMQTRYYNPYICRFLNPDPSGFAGGLNFYAYANGNPVSEADPFGLYGNPVSGPDGPLWPSSLYAPGGALYVPSPLPPPGPGAYLAGGLIVGAVGAAAVTVAAPAAVGGLVAVGVPTATATATVTTTIGSPGWLAARRRYTTPGKMLLLVIGTMWLLMPELLAAALFLEDLAADDLSQTM